MITRFLDEKFFSWLFKGDTIILQGARKLGKTTLLKEFQKKYPQSVFLNADNPAIASLLTNPVKEALEPVIAKNRLLIIDDAQQLPDPTQTIKHIIDHFPHIQLVLCTALNFEKSQALNSATIKQIKFIQLFAISYEEWNTQPLSLKKTDALEERLVFGMYPDVLIYPKDREIFLKDLTTKLLLKDIMLHSNPRKPSEIKKLLQLLAHQICSELNYSELAENLGIDIKTAIRYVDMLEEAFIVFRLPSYSQKVKTEITKGRKVYFYDNGVRNALLDQFQAFGERMDKDLLWENFMVAERRKFNSYHRRPAKMYFWRTIQHQKIDLVEEKEGLFKAFQFKYSAHKPVKVPLTFSRNYPTSVQTINRKNFEPFLSV